MGVSRQEYWSGVPLPSPNIVIYKYIYIYTHTHIYIYLILFLSAEVIFYKKYLFLGESLSSSVFTNKNKKSLHLSEASEMMKLMEYIFFNVLADY